ncbi:MAG: dihydroneopterin triphosphate diphosphatase [Alphaproteobacteria bacterium]|nr:dihydroneopterin triphosphate diphosphatase [Alphaproteobacteria bacterium]
MSFSLPESVLVIVHTPDLQVLLLQRVGRVGWWQSVTGAREPEDETLLATARRELREETGIDADAAWCDWQWANRYVIWPSYRHRYPPDVTHNVEHTFSACVPAPRAVRLAPDEHERYVWMPWRDAVARCLSPTNREALKLLPAYAAGS